jgi:hypothetical protein
MKPRAVGQQPRKSEFSIARAVALGAPSSSSNAGQAKRPWLEELSRARITWLLTLFWSLVLTLVLIMHVNDSSSITPTAATRHGHVAFTLSTKLNMALTELSSFDYDNLLLSYRICCRFPGGHMECPDGREMECHLQRDSPARLACYWVATRLEGAQCTLYWVAAAASSAK